MSDIDPVRWDRVAGYAACATGRAMAVNRFLLREAVAELSDAEAVLAERGSTRPAERSNPTRRPPACAKASDLKPTPYRRRPSGDSRRSHGVKNDRGFPQAMPEVQGADPAEAASGQHGSTVVSW